MKDNGIIQLGTISRPAEIVVSVEQQSDPRDSLQHDEDDLESGRAPRKSQQIV